MKEGDYAIIKNDSIEYGFKVFKATKENLGMLNELKAKRVLKPRDIEEGDEVIVSFKENEEQVYGIAEVTLVDYSVRKGFSVYMDRNSTNPGESFRIQKEDMKFKLID